MSLPVPNHENHITGHFDRHNQREGRDQSGYRRLQYLLQERCRRAVTGCLTTDIAATRSPASVFRQPLRRAVDLTEISIGMSLLQTRPVVQKIDNMHARDQMIRDLFPTANLGAADRAIRLGIPDDILDHLLDTTRAIAWNGQV